MDRRGRQPDARELAMDRRRSRASRRRLEATSCSIRPCVDPGDGRPWAERDDTFLCIGRFHGSKRIETAMSIVGRARAARCRDARLIVVGSAVDREYTTRIAAARGRVTATGSSFVKISLATS